MVTDGKLALEGHNSPKALAESMAKRYNQMHAALPDSNEVELFHFILENRYKLLGKTIPLSSRKKMVDEAFGSVTLLTFNALLTEHPEVTKPLSQEKELVHSIVETMADTINKETKSKVLSLDECLKHAYDFLDSMT